MKYQKPVNLTVGFPRTHAMDVLEASSTVHGFEFVALPNAWKSERLRKIDKFTLIKYFLASGNVSPDAMLLFTDAYDVLITDSATRIRQLFLLSGADLLFNAETTYFPIVGRDPHVKDLFDSCSSAWRYLNSGCFLGYAWAVEKLVDYGLAIAAKDPNADDQALSQDFYYMHRSGRELKVDLDVGLNIFASINATSHEFVVRSNGVYHASTGKAPISILHANGDKSNIVALETYFNTFINRRSEGSLTLKVLRVENCYTKLDVNSKKLVTTSEFTKHVIFFAVVGNRRAVGFSGEGAACLTFDGDRNVYSNRDDAHNWEVVSVRESLRSFHGLDLAHYFAVQPVHVELSDTSLNELKPEFARVFCENLSRFTLQLLAMPWIGP